MKCKKHDCPKIMWC